MMLVHKTNNQTGDFMNSIEHIWSSFRPWNGELIYIAAAVSLFSLVGCSDGSDNRVEKEEPSAVLVKGAPLVGGANGMFFDQEDVLFVGNVLGQSITKLDSETGEIIGKLGREEGVAAGADDLTFDAFGTLYWTDPAAGKVMGLNQAGETFTVAEGFPQANPITVSDDGRLFLPNASLPEQTDYSKPIRWVSYPPPLFAEKTWTAPPMVWIGTTANFTHPDGSKGA